MRDYVVYGLPYLRALAVLAPHPLARALQRSSTSESEKFLDFVFAFFVVVAAFLLVVVSVTVFFLVLFAVD